MGPGYDAATDWVDVEFDNLRAGFRRATDRGDLGAATAIAAHTTTIAFGLQQFEPIGWAEELLPAAAAVETASGGFESRPIRSTPPLSISQHGGTSALVRGGV